MTGRTHLVAGALSSFALLPITEYSIIYLVVAGLGGLFPDIDASDAKIHHTGFRINRRIKIEPFRLITVFTSGVFKHRGWIHSLLGLVVFSGIFGFVMYYFLAPTNIVFLVLSFVVGYFSHLVTDGMTPAGVPLFYPVAKKKIHFLPRPLRIRTGKGAEQAIEMLLLVFLGLGLVWLYFSGHISADIFNWHLEIGN